MTHPFRIVAARPPVWRGWHVVRKGSTLGVRFLHTSDWQLGMTRAFLSAEAQARYTDDQFAAVRTLARLAGEHGCAFVVVAGDVFESFRPSRAVVHRAVDALREFPVPVYLLPGNHDPDNPAGCWSAPELLDALPPGVVVLRDPSPVAVPGVAAEVVGAPWPTGRPDADLLAEALAPLAVPPPGIVRVAVGHGQVETLVPEQPDAPLVRLAAVRGAVTDGVVSYVALGDRHSTTEVAPAIWYSGAPVATDFDEVDPNQALVVDVGAGEPVVTPVPVGGWRFVDRRFDLAGAEAVDLVADFLAGLTDKERTVVRLGLVGTLRLADHQRLQRVLDQAADLLAGVRCSARRSELVVVADDAEADDLGLSGFARDAVAELAARAAGSGPDAAEAGDALLLCARLAGRAS